MLKNIPLLVNFLLFLLLEVLFLVMYVFHLFLCLRVRVCVYVFFSYFCPNVLLTVQFLLF